MLIAADNVICLRCGSALQDAVVRRVNGNNINGLRRLHSLRKAQNLLLRLDNFLLRPKEFVPTQRLADLLHNGVGNHNLKRACLRRFQKLLWHAAEIQGGNVYIGIGDGSNHLQPARMPLAHICNGVFHIAGF